MKHNNYLKYAVYIFWLLLWGGISAIINNPIYFAGPLDTVRELVVKISDPVFWYSVSASLIRILAGFLTAFFAAVILACLSYRFTPLEDLLNPFISFIRSVPVAAVVVILLIWWGSENLVLSISFMVIFPNIYGNMLTGLMETDKKLLEMAAVFRMPLKERVLWIYRPACFPYLTSSLSLSLGMGFKAGIAAEIIGLPSGSIGNLLYHDKIYFNTAGVFSWIIVILILSTLTEKAVLFIAKRLFSVPDPLIKEVSRPAFPSAIHPSGLVLTGITKDFGDGSLFNVSLSLEPGSIYHLSGSSGLGKTTLLNIISGLILPDSGSLDKSDTSMVFQEDRLIPCANALRNLEAAGCLGDLKEVLLSILPSEAILKPADNLSGGEKRRVAIARAVLFPSEVVLMDEPFTGLDPESKTRAVDFIFSNLKGRTLFIVSHDEEDAALLNARRLYLKDGVITA
ncbi:MAG: ATP-binding cassette domain-containing protein [Lachnospiraceae bacterium]|nr:ATP-binding cassette domain-containing protein [Lachnospiraceae bacterium]